MFDWFRKKHEKKSCATCVFAGSRRRAAFPAEDCGDYLAIMVHPEVLRAEAWEHYLVCDNPVAIENSLKEVPDTHFCEFFLSDLEYKKGIKNV